MLLDCSLPQHMSLLAHRGTPTPKPPQSHMDLVSPAWRIMPGVYQAGLP